MNKRPNVTKITSLLNFPDIIDVGNGYNFIGEGPVGTDDRGPIVVCEKDGFLFNASEDQYNGTGGSIENLKIFKKVGYNNGTAIKLTATGPDRRCGETLLRRLLIYGGNSGSAKGLWDCGIHIDGTMLTTSGSAGIRTTTIENVRIADCLKSAILLENAVHCKITNLQIDPGRVSSIKMDIVGGQNIVGSEFIVNGTLNVTGAKTVILSGFIDTIILKDVEDFIFTGKVNNLIVDAKSSGTFLGKISKKKENVSGKFNIYG